MRHHASLLDRLVGQFDHALRTLNGVQQGTGKPSPATTLEDSLVEPSERVRAGRLMRVDHAGEVMAQALYQGQAFMSRETPLRTHLEQAAREEADHLSWCEERLREFRMRPSLLNPLWYIGGWVMGASAARLGRGTNLGLVVEVERQVEAHIEDHLQQLPADDIRSRAILNTMQEEEIQHGQNAMSLGGRELPLPARLGMRLLSRLMTRGSLWI